MDSTVLNNLKALVTNYYGQINLTVRYSDIRYSVPIESCPIKESIKTIIRSYEDNLQSNLMLKEKLKKEMKNSAENMELNFWIINTWGAVKTFKRNEDNQQRISTFYEQVKKGEGTAFNSIASFSKVVSFINPDRYYVYDSRVAYSLNWLLRKSGAKKGFFPIPPGQSKLAMECSLSKLLKDEYGDCFIPKAEAYGNYCELIRSICPDGEKPYKIEMLLFQMAGKEMEIYNDFKAEFAETEYFKPSDQQDKNQRIDLNRNDEKSIPGRSHSPELVETQEYLNGDVIYTYVARDSKKRFCEIWNPKHYSYPNEAKFREKGFEKHGGSKPYLILNISNMKESEVIRLLEYCLRILKL